MQVIQENVLSIALVNEEIDYFLALINKIKSEMDKSNKIGFKKSFSKEELEFVNNLITNINGEDK